MTDNVKHSTSYYHEAIAKAFEMFKNGYEPVMETPFQPRRQGSAFVTEYKLAGVSENNSVTGEISAEEKVEFDFWREGHYSRRKEKQLTIHEKWEIDDQINFEADEAKKLAESKSCDKIVYTKEQLDAMHWDDLKPMLDKAGIKGRRRQNMIRDFLKKQEEDK